MKTQSKLEIKYSEATGKPTTYTNGYTQGYTGEYTEWLESIIQRQASGIQRSELFSDFERWLNKIPEFKSNNSNVFRLIKEFKSLNCG